MGKEMNAVDKWRKNQKDRLKKKKKVIEKHLKDKGEE